MIPIQKIICGDNIEILTEFPSESIDLVVTSPPYDDMRNYNGAIYNFKGLVSQLKRVLKEGGVIVWVVGDQTIDFTESLTSFNQAIYFKEMGFCVRTMFYEKSGFRFPDNSFYYRVVEYMFIISKGKPKTFNPIIDRNVKNTGTVHKNSTRRNIDGTLSIINSNMQYGNFGIRYNIWKYDAGYMLSTKDEIAFKHPAIFPDKLAEDHILSWSNKDDIVLDPFCGSGTTCKMAYLNQRNYIGIDINKEYCDIAIERLKINRTIKENKKLITRGIFDGRKK